MKREIKETLDSHYDNYSIMTDRERGLSCNTEILREIKRQFDYAEESKSKVYFFRYDARFPENMHPKGNEIFSDFQANFMKNLSRQGLKPQYIAVREQSKEKHQHYHVVVLLDGQKTQSIHNHIKTAERLWDSALGLEPRENGYGLIDDCTTSRTGEKQINGVMLRPDDPEMERRKMTVSDVPVTLPRPLQRVTPQNISGRCFLQEYPNQALDIVRFYDK